jgi:hypothetical protein
MHVDVEIQPRPARVLADQAGGVGFGDRPLQGLALVDVFAAGRGKRRGWGKKERVRARLGSALFALPGRNPTTTPLSFLSLSLPPFSPHRM